MGSSLVAGWIAHITFWVLIVVGWDDLGPLRIGVLVAIWIGGLLGLSHIPFGAGLFVPLVAVLDIVLVFMVFKGDVRLH
jgi:hypothetical protein